MDNATAYRVLLNAWRQANVDATDARRRAAAELAEAERLAAAADKLHVELDRLIDKVLSNPG